MCTAEKRDGMMTVEHLGFWHKDGNEIMLASRRRWGQDLTICFLARGQTLLCRSNYVGRQF